MEPVDCTFQIQANTFKKRPQVHLTGWYTGQRNGLRLSGGVTQMGDGKIYVIPYFILYNLILFLCCFIITKNLAKHSSNGWKMHSLIISKYYVITQLSFYVKSCFV